jgi:probable rRNA maturation factor
MDERWSHSTLFWEETISQALEKAAQTLGKNFSHQEISVVLSDDQHVQSLNKTYRQKDKPTNVLSFNSEGEGELGDIILAYETVINESQGAGISCVHHTLHLIIHGFLHLLGYDHEDEQTAEQMEDMEIKILKTLNIDNPYEVL